MLKYEMDEKAVRQQVTERGREKRKGSFFPPELNNQAYKVVKSDEERRKKEGLTSSRFEIWYGQKPREEKKERKTRLKEKKREREKEREEKLFSPIVKIRKDEKKEKERIRQSVKKKGDERKVKWEKKKWKKRRKNSELYCLFFLWYSIPPPFFS